jgi:hypothetical protein
MKLFSENPRYVEAEHLLVRLHEMIAADQGGTDEADELREEAKVLWKDLAMAEQEQLQRISVELGQATNRSPKARGSFPGDYPTRVIQKP